jgi:hypothetical protein
MQLLLRGQTFEFGLTAREYMQGKLGEETVRLWKKKPHTAELCEKEAIGERS